MVSNSGTYVVGDLCLWWRRGIAFDDGRMSPIVSCRRLFARRRSVLAVAPIVALIAAAPTAAAGSSSSGAHLKAGKQRATVMTRNLYLGADLTPVVSAANPITGIVSVLQTVEASKPATRMAMVAHEIASARPLLVGLQEVENWNIPGMNPLDPTQRLVPAASYDFLKLLTRDLAADGQPYRVVVTQKNFDSTAQLPALLKPLASFSDRDVIIARSGLPKRRLAVLNTYAHHFRDQLTIPLAALGSTIDFARGYEWATVKTDGTVWRFVNTHPEAHTPAQLGLSGPDVNGPQMAELAKALKGFEKPIILAGDLNSALNDPALHGYAVLRRAGFSDTWLKLGLPDRANTCCRNETLTAGSLTQRIDHVMARGAVFPVSARRTSVAPVSTTQPRWPSDHTGVITTLSMARRGR